MGVCSGLRSTSRSQILPAPAVEEGPELGGSPRRLSDDSRAETVYASRFISDDFRAARSRCGAAGRNALTGRCLLTSFPIYLKFGM